jgi:hypothetical protein
MGNLMGTTSVTFGEGGAAVTYSSALKVDFVPKAPVLSSIERVPLDDDVDSATATFSITSRANGNANYTLEYDVELTNLEGPEPGVTAPLTIENLGATAVVKVNEGLLSVPSDGAADAEVNGIKATDKVMIDGVEYTVGTVADNGATATITLAAPGLDGANPSLGTPIWEKQEVTLTLADIGVAEVEGPSNVTVTVTASYEGLSNDTTFIASRTVEVLPWARTYVRNLDEIKNPAPEAVADLPEETKYQVDETWYFSSLAGADSEEGLAEADYNEAAQVKAAAGDTLEYVIVVSAGNTQPEQEFSIVETFPPFAINPQFQFDKVVSRLAGAFARNPEWLTETQVTWDWSIGINQSTRFVYTLQLGEPDEDEPEIAETYTGCLLDEEDRQEECYPDGTLWPFSGDILGQQNCPEEGKGCANSHTACWDPLPVPGKWVVGANVFDPFDDDGWIEQTHIRLAANSDVDGPTAPLSSGRLAGSSAQCK